MKNLRPLIIASAIGLLASPAFGQSFSGPATIAAPTTPGDCVKVATQGGNALADAGAGCGTPSGAAGGGLSGTYPNPGVVTGTTGSSIPRLNGNNVWSGSVIVFSALPTADPHLAGELWNNAGVLQVSAG